MLTVALLAQGLYLLASLILTAKVTLRLKSVVRGGLCLYGLTVLGAMLFCVVLPGLLVAVGADKDTVLGAFPEATGVPFVILTMVDSGVRMPRVGGLTTGGGVKGSLTWTACDVSNAGAPPWITTVARGRL